MKVEMAADLKAVRSNVGCIAVLFVFPLVLGGVALVVAVLSALGSHR